MHARLKMVGASLLLISLGLPLQRTTPLRDPDLGVQQVYRTGRTVAGRARGPPAAARRDAGSDTYAIETGSPMNGFFVSSSSGRRSRSGDPVAEARSRLLGVRISSLRCSQARTPDRLRVDLLDHVPEPPGPGGFLRSWPWGSTPSARSGPTPPRSGAGDGSDGLGGDTGNEEHRALDEVEARTGAPGTSGALEPAGRGDSGASASRAQGPVDPGSDRRRRTCTERRRRSSMCSPVGSALAGGRDLRVREGDCIVHVAETEAHTLRAGPEGSTCSPSGRACRSRSATCRAPAWPTPARRFVAAPGPKILWRTTRRRAARVPGPAAPGQRRVG